MFDLMGWAKRDPLEHISAEVQALAARGTPVSKDEYAAMRMNSYERAYLLPHLSTECLTSNARYCLTQCNIHPRPCSYDEVMLARVVPELLNRLEGTLVKT